MSEERCSECGATDVPLEYGMCAECCEVDGAFGYQPPIVRTRRMIDYAKYEAAQAEITALRAALDQERADNERLRAFAVAVRGIMLDPAHKMTFATIKAFADAFARNGVMDANGNIIGDALLSGRGEG